MVRDLVQPDRVGRGAAAGEGLRRRAHSLRHVGLAVVFHGWELVSCEAVECENA